MHISVDSRNKLMALYGEGHRYYHNMRHIEDSLKCLDDISKTYGIVEDTKLVEIMIWFHDAIYEVGSHITHGYNERMSREFFLASVAAAAMSDEERTVVADAISASAEHTVMVEGLNFQQQLFLDIDLHSMGCSYSTFLENGENIRKEYNFVSEDVFNYGRRKFFEKLLSRERIYYTEQMYEIYENETRKNIQAWLQSA